MIIFIYGPDTYRSRQKLNEIVERYTKIHQHGLNFKKFDFKETNFEDFKNEIQQSSIFNGKKLAILTNTFLNSEFKEKFKKDIQFFKNAEDIILFYEDEKILESDKFALFLKKQSEWEKFDLLKTQKLNDWVKEEFKKRKMEIEELALSHLIDFTGNDTWRLSNEIEKLCLYNVGKNEISAEDVKVLVKPKIETDIFKTIETLAKKEKSKTLELIQKHLEKGDSVFYLLSMINFQLRNLLMIKSYGLPSNSFDIAQSAGIHPFVIKKTINLAEKFSLEELKKAYQKIFEIDLNIKSGKIEPEAGLKALIVDL
ncbi:DNA polymerase III subunit delta [Patescibacteria group bacterium]|nr:DNA polymerase III subunit delta [Patescibacteria group bacterium]